MPVAPIPRRSSKLSVLFKPSLVYQTCLILTSLPATSAGDQTLLANQAVSQTLVKSEVAQTNAQRSSQSQTNSPVQSSTPLKPTIAVSASAKAKATAPKNATSKNVPPKTVIQPHAVAQPKAQAAAQLRQAQTPSPTTSPITSATPPKRSVELPELPQPNAIAPKNAAQPHAVAQPKAQAAAQLRQTQTTSPTTSPVKSTTSPKRSIELPKLPQPNASTPKNVAQPRAVAQPKAQAAQLRQTQTTSPTPSPTTSPIKPATSPKRSIELPKLPQPNAVAPKNAPSKNAAQPNKVTQTKAKPLTKTKVQQLRQTQTTSLTTSSVISATPPKRSVDPPESAAATKTVAQANAPLNLTTQNDAVKNNQVPSIASAPIITTGIRVTIDNRTYERAAAVSVRGFGYGETREEFEQWLIPLETVLDALQIKSRQINDQELELTSQFAVTRLALNSLANDPELGLSITVKQVEDRLKLPTHFDVQESAIVFDLPKVTAARTAGTRKELFLDGLPTIGSPNFSLGMVEQRVSASGTTTTQNFRPKGTFLTVGSLLGGSWYAELQQNKVLSPRDWQLNSFQFLTQTPQRDFFVGAQPTFWQGQAAGDFWGITTIGRQGFTPDVSLAQQGGANPAARLQPAFVNVSLPGYAEPGTLVRVMRGGEGGVLVAEQLVDASGRYEFRNIPVGREAESGTNYQLLLYPQGQLTATPRIETPRFILVPEQLPAGASSQIISAGWRRSQGADDFFGQFTQFSAGLSQRWGVAESLTLGLGSVYDNSRLQGIGELFFQPKGTPFRFSATGLLAAKSDVQLAAAWENYPNLSAQWSYSGSKHTYNIDFPIPGVRSFRFNAYGDTDRGSYWGLQFSQGFRGGSIYGRLALQPSGKFGWDLFQNFYRLSFSHRKTDSGITNSASYRVNQNNSVVLEYNTLNALSSFAGSRRNSQLFNAFWRYQSSNYQIDGMPLWGLELGYGLSNIRSGPYISVTTSVIPGLFFEAKYQGASLFNDTGQFSLSLVSSMGTQSGLYAGNRRLNEMRAQGGLMVQAFIDRNANGKRDSDEELYTESTDYLKINYEFLPAYRMEQHSDRVLVRLVPGQYRIDLDPAGFPMEFQPTDTTLAVNVREGSYTPVIIPLQPVYTLSGVITKPNGQPASGVRIEAINQASQKSQFTLTNGAGVYYLETLRRGQYQIRINGKPLANQVVQITEKSEPLQEMNFKMDETTSQQ